jgi:hypothetical protein
MEDGAEVEDRQVAQSGVFIFLFFVGLNPTLNPTLYILPKTWGNFWDFKGRFCYD